MVRVEFEVGVYTEHFERALSWYLMNFGKENHPSAKDKEAFELFNTLVRDGKRQDREEENE